MISSTPGKGNFGLKETLERRDVAYTAVGRNLLFVGLVTHVAALFLSMTPDFGIRSYFYFLYLSSWALSVAGLFLEMRDRGYRPAREVRFLLLSLVALLPFIGPLTAWIALYLLAGTRKTTPFSLFGMIASFFRLRASGAVLLITLLLLSALFAFIYSTHDPYFKRVREKRGTSMERISPGVRSPGNATGAERNG
jgi:hypothetical protein